MASLLIQSPAFQASGIAMNSQSFTEDISGLVRASLTFTTTASRSDEISQLFYVDAPPPIWPDSIDRFSLQSQQLYMISRTVEKFAGLVTIKAQYAGALSNAISNPRVSIERQSINFNLQIYVSQQVTQTQWKIINGKWYLVPITITSFNVDTGTSSYQSSIVPAYDYYSGNATIGVKRVSFASVGEDTFSITPPAISSLILGATSTTTQLQDLSYQWNPYPTGGENPFPPNSGYGEGQSGPSGQFVGGPYYERSRTAVSLLAEFGKYALAQDSGIEFITPTVFVKTARFWLV